MKINKNMVFFDKKNNAFCQIREFLDNGAICSHANYYTDAKTTICEVPYSLEYMEKNFISVEDMGIDKIAEYDGIGWRVRE